MLEKALRHHYQRTLVDPVAKAIHKLISPMQVTLLSVLFGILIIPSLYNNYTHFAIILLFISGYLDTLDGTVARHANNATDLGSVCDIMADRTVEFSAIFALWLVSPDTRAMFSILMLGSILLCITSFLVVGIFTPNRSNKSFHYSAGLIERAEAFIFFTLMMLLPNYFARLAGLFCTLVTITTLIRLYEFYKHHESSNLAT